MVDNNSLVVVLDEESRETCDMLGWRYFPGGRKRDDRDYVIETPLGSPRVVRGTLVDEPNLRYHSSEYLYLEVTDYCNFRCKHCGVGDEVVHLPITEIVSDGGVYITERFVEGLADALSGDYPNAVGYRRLFYGGGEPLLNPQRFGEINKAFASLDRTFRVVVTNGCSVPLDFEKFRDYVDQIGRPSHLFLTVSKEHMRQYRVLTNRLASGDYDLEDFIPSPAEAKEPLIAKADILDKHTKRLRNAGFDLEFLVLTLSSRSDTSFEEEIREAILREGTSNPALFGITVDGTRDPCSKAQELSIRTNGDLYPHCYDIFTGRNKIGIVGFLLGEDNGEL